MGGRLGWKCNHCKRELLDSAKSCRFCARQRDWEFTDETIWIKDEKEPGNNKPSPVEPAKSKEEQKASESANKNGKDSRDKDGRIRKWLKERLGK